MKSSPLLAATGISKKFSSSSGGANRTLTAVDEVTLTIDQGETVGIAGESGCGKSTLAKIIAGLLPLDSGQISYRGGELSSLTNSEYRTFRRKTQMIFQDPFSSLNPRMRIGDSISEPMLVAGLPEAERTMELHRIMGRVGLPLESANRFPDEFSGGQRQRIGIARALAASPEIIIADEPVSSLDISIQAQIINILLQMKSDSSLSLLIVSHNLMVLRHLCDRIVIMYLGTVVESGNAAEIFSRCRHPYTEALLAAIPGIDGSPAARSLLLCDDIPSAFCIPEGCRFHPRCRHAVERCRLEAPALAPVTGSHSSACHLTKQLYGE